MSGKPLDGLVARLRAMVADPPRPADLAPAASYAASRVRQPYVAARSPRSAPAARTHVMVFATEGRLKVRVVGPASPRYRAELKIAVEKSVKAEARVLLERKLAGLVDI